MKPVRLPASATNALPRWVLLFICLIYILSGLLGRDPWKNEDAIGFGIMWTMAYGGLDDWLMPHVAGLPILDNGPLAFWIGAIGIKLLGWLLGDFLAARVATFGFFLLGSASVWYATYLLGRRPEAQPLRLAFGGQPEPRDYGRTLADGALLIYVGCLGLLLHSHSASANALHVSLMAFAVLAAARLAESGSLKAALLLGVALGSMSLAQDYILPSLLWLGILILAMLRQKPLALKLLLITLPVMVLLAVSWPLASHYARPYGSTPHDAWLYASWRQIGLPSYASLRYLFKNGIWFAWPAWPFAGWAIYAWRRQSSALHIVLPLLFAVVTILAALFTNRPDESSLLPLLPPLVILAAFGLPTMKRGAINAVDWFSVMTLTFCAAFIWLGWIAKQTGWPAWLARNAFKLAPGFTPEFGITSFGLALTLTALWIATVVWRVSRRPSVLWRAVVLSSGGVVLCWVLITTLWMPWINYGKSYAGVARQLGAKLPESGYCVETNVGPAQRASFATLGKVNFVRFDGAQCDYLLLQEHSRANNAPTTLNRAGQSWRLQWEGRRPADREERFSLYRRPGS